MASHAPDAANPNPPKDASLQVGTVIVEVAKQATLLSIEIVDISANVANVSEQVVEQADLFGRLGHAARCRPTAATWAAVSS